MIQRGTGDVDLLHNITITSSMATDSSGSNRPPPDPGGGGLGSLLASARKAFRNPRSDRSIGSNAPPSSAPSSEQQQKNPPLKPTPKESPPPNKTLFIDETPEPAETPEVFTEIATAEHEAHLKKHGEDAMAIPTMNLFAIKPDEEGNPIRAKSRIVALGNLEQRIWSGEDRHAPVSSGTGARLLVSMAVEDGRRLKQGDCKNAFCNGILPEDEVIIVKPPQDCPRSKRGTCWKSNKTSHGLARSAHHWHTAMSGHLADDLGFKAMDHDKCVFKCQPFPDKPPMYVGLHADDFVYCSKSDEVEQWFENELKSHVKVDFFMGDVNWFLGQRYDWFTDSNNKVSCHISQQAFIEGMLHKFNLTHISPASTPHRSGLKINRIDQDGATVNSKAFTQRYQSIMGCLNWLTINTRPDINTAFSLLSQFNNNPSEGHWEADLLHHGEKLSSPTPWGFGLTSPNSFLVIA